MNLVSISLEVPRFIQLTGRSNTLRRTGAGPRPNPGLLPKLRPRMYLSAALCISCPRRGVLRGDGRGGRGR